MTSINFNPVPFNLENNNIYTRACLKNPISSLSDEEIFNESWLKDYDFSKILELNSNISSSQEAPFVYFIDFLKKSMEFMGKNGIHFPKLDVKRYEDCFEIQKKMNSVDSEVYSNELILKAKNLKKNDFILLPGGYSGDESEFMLYKLQKQSNGKFTFTIISSVGSEYNDSLVSHNKEKHLSTLSFKDIHSDKIYSKEFFKHIIDLQVLKSKNISANVNKNSIYHGLVTYLDGKPEKIKKIPESYYKSDASLDNSTVKTLSAELFHHLTEGKNKKDFYNQYKLLMFFMKREELLALSSEYLISDSYDRSKHKIISQKASQWANAANKLLSKMPSFDKNILKKVECTIIDINEKLADHKKIYKIHPQPEPLNYNLNDTNKIVSPGKYIYTEDINKIYTYYDYNKVDPYTTSLFNISSTNLSSQESIKKFLNHSLDELSKQSSLNNKFLIEVIRMLPMPTHGNDIWDEIEISEIEEIMVSIEKLSKFCYYSKDQSSFPENFLSLNILLGIGDKLARRLPESLLTPEDKISHYELSVFFFSSLATFNHPKDHQRIIDLLKYMDPEFDFSELPTLDVMTPYKKETQLRDKTIFSINSDCRTYNESDPWSNKDFHFLFLRRYLDNPRTKAALKEKNLHNRSELEQTLALFSESKNEAKLLPRSIHLLRQLAFAIQTQGYGYQNVDFKKIDDYEFNFLIKAPKKQYNYWSSHFSTFVANKLGTRIQPNSLTTLAFTIKNNGKNIFLNLPRSATETNSQNEIMHSYLLEEPREAYLINSNPEDEIIRTLAYFNNGSLEKLEDVNVQQILYLHFFKPGRLLLQIQKEPESVIKIFASLANFMNKFIQQNKFQPAAFFAAQGYRFKQNVDEFLKNNSHKFTTEQLIKIQEMSSDFRKTILDAIQGVSLEISTHADVYLELALMHESDFDIDVNKDPLKFKELATDILISNLIIPLSMIEKPDTLRSKIKKMECLKKVGSNHIETIKKVLDENKSIRNEIFNGILKAIETFLPNPPIELSWEIKPLTGGSFVSSNDQYEFDLDKNMIIIEGKPMAGLPMRFMQNPLFSKLFKDIKHIHSLEETNTILEIKDANGISKVNTSQLTDGISRKFNDSDEIFRYVPYHYSKKIIQEIPYAFLDPLDIETSIWLQETKDPNDKSQYFMIENHRTHQRLYVHLKGQRFNQSIDYVSDTLNGSRCLINPHTIRNNFTYLSKFVSLEKVAFWADLKDQSILTEIEIPHMNLHFRIQNIEGEYRAICREVPGYYISPFQDEEYVGKDDHSIILINNLGHKKVLIAKGNYSVSEDGHSYDPGLHFNARVNKAKITKYNVFDLEEINGKLRLKPATISDAVQLVSFLFLKKRYRQVQYYLKYLHGLSKYPKKDIDIVMNLIKHGDTHPSAIALKLKLFIALRENALKYDPESLKDFSEAEAEGIAVLFSTYLNNMGKCRLEPLSIDEEKTLLQLIEKAKMLVFPILAQRVVSILEPKSLKLKNGIKTSLKLPPASKVSDISRYSFFVSYASTDETKQEKLNLDSLTTVSLNNFIQLLPNLYFLARHGDQATRMKLKNILDLLEGSNALNSPINITHACLLKNVCANPNKFPTSNEINECSNFVYKGKFRESERAYWNDYHKLQTEWYKKRNSVYAQIQKYGKNSRATGLIDGLKQVIDIYKKSNFCSPILAKKIHRSEPMLPKGNPPSDFGKEMILDSKIIEEDQEWNQFFKGFFDDSFFAIQTNPTKKNKELQKDVDMPQGKKRDLIENMEKFYETIPETENQYTFDLSRENEFIEKIHVFLHKHIDKLWDENPEVTGDVLTEKPHLDHNHRSIENKIELIVTYRRMQIEKIASKLPTNSTIKTHLERLSKVDQPLTLNELIGLFEIGSKEAYLKESKLSEAQCLEIDKEIGLYGIEVTRCLQLKQVLGILKDLKTKVDENEIKTLHQRLGEQVKIHRSHLSNGNIERSRSYLRFEMQEGIMLRPIQITVLDELINQKEPLQLLQILGTGSGKTAILSPMQQWLRRKNGSRLLMNVWPSQHYTENKKLIRNQVVQNYEQRADTFDFNRQSSIEPDSLFFIYKELRKAISEKRQLNTTPESLQNFELRFLEVLFNISNEGIIYPDETVPLFQKILKLLKEAEIHVDEGHKNFSPKREVNFTIGDPTIEKNEHVSLIASIYEILISDKELNDLVKLKTNEQNFLTEEKFNQIILPKLINAFAEKLEIQKENYDDFSKYVSDKEVGIPDSLKSHKNLSLIALLRGELVFILKETLSKNTSVHYGLSKKDKNLNFEYAKPYDANDSCIESAEYDNTTEALNKTYQTYIYKRLTFQQQKKLITFIKDSIEDEIDQKPIGYSMKDTIGYKFFMEHFPSSMTKKSIFSLTDSDLKDHFQAINDLDSIMFYYIKMIVVPQIKKYRYTIKSDAQNLRSMFKDVTTLTATPGSVHTYGFSKDAGMAHKTLNHGNDFEVLNMLNIKCIDNSQFRVVSTEVPEEILKETIKFFANEDRGVRMLTDIGALFKGVSNVHVAKEILNQVPYIKGVVFYNENDHLMVLEREGNRIISLKESLLTPQERFTYCDNKHMFGSDTKQAPNAIGLCTYGLHNDLDDVLQGVGRLREFLKDQNAVWIATESTMKTINADYIDQPSLFALIRDHAISNQENNEKDNLFRSLKQQMRNEIRSACMKKLIECHSNKSIELFKKFNIILVNDDLKDPLSMYGSKHELISGHQALKKYKEKLIGILATVKGGFTKNEYQQIIKNLNLYEKKIIEFESKNAIPHEVNEFNGELGTEAEIQIQTQVETEIEIETLVENRSGLEYRKESEWPTNLDIFSKDWIKPTSIESVMKKSRTTAFDIANHFKDKFFFPTRMTRKLLKNFTVVNTPEEIKRKKVATLIHKVIKTVNMVAFLILGLPIYIVLGMVGAGIETFKFIFLRNKKINEEVKINKFGKRRARKACKTKVPMYPLEEIIKIHSEKAISGASKFFKEENGNKILFTNNLLRKVPEKKNETTIKALGKEQKAIHEIIVVEDTIKGKKQYTIIAGDQSTDARFFRKKLAEDKLKGNATQAASRTRKICLYDLSLGVVQNGINPIDEIALSNDPNFLKLLLQLKLYNGEVKYNEKEEAEIVKLIQNKENREILQNFLKRSFAWRDQKAKAYSSSRLKKILTTKKYAA